MKRFRKILYVAEPSVAQDAAIARAVTLATNNLAELTVIDVIPPETADIGLPHGGPVSSDFQAAIEDRHRKVLESLIEPHRQTMAIGIEVRVGKTFLETIRAVLREGYDLVIKPAENPEFMERLFGSDDMHLLRKCPCPLWLMHPTEKPNYDCIVAAIDFDSSKPETVNQGLNQQIVELATTLAISDFTELHLLHAWDAPAEMMLRMWSNNPEEAAHQYIAEVRACHQKGMDLLQVNLHEQFDEEAYGYLSPQFHLLQGLATAVIPKTAAHLHADLVVMGTVARTGIPGVIIGNTAETLLEQLQCSVLALKPPGFVTPVKLDD